MNRVLDEERFNCKFDAYRDILEHMCFRNIDSYKCNCDVCCGKTNIDIYYSEFRNWTQLIDAIRGSQIHYFSISSNE